jgi:hypothetical protein
MRIRVTCKAPDRPAPPASQGVTIHGCCASWPDVRVVAIADDGTETELTNVTGVRFAWEAGNEAATVVLTMVDVDVEVEGKPSPSFSFPLAK